MRHHIRLILLLPYFTACENPSDRISKLEANMDSVKTEIEILKLELKKTKDSVSFYSKNLSKTKTNTNKVEVPKLAIPFFINQRMSQIKNYWESRVSIEYFDEGTWSDTNDKYFSIMVGNIGSPEFSATFDSKGLCKSHATKIGYSDISVMQARLKNAGYTYSENCKCWTLSGQNHTWTITGPFGPDYEIECKRK